jgi:hypothetical protein
MRDTVREAAPVRRRGNRVHRSVDAAGPPRPPDAMTARTIPHPRGRERLQGMAVVELHDPHERYGDTVAVETWPGAWPHPVHLVTMVVRSLVAGAVAARTFCWE